MRLLRIAALALGLGLVCGPAAAGSANVAVAANFAEPARELTAAFKAATGHDLSLSIGSSGIFFAQIKQHAPFDVFLSADAERSQKLIDDGLADPASRFTYAIGKLVLWTRDKNAKISEETLKSAAFSKLSIANPAAAPYGAAALETLANLGVLDGLRPKIVEGASIGQAYQFVASGNAELGFVALSQTVAGGGSSWLVPQALYTPIRQDAVLLIRAAGNPAAKAFMAFLKGREAAEIIGGFGYGRDPGG